MKTGYIPKEDRKKILLLCDDIRLHSGIGTMAKEFVINNAHHFNWVNLGAAIKHPEAGQRFDISADTGNQIGINDASVFLYPIDGYGNPDLLRQLIQIEKYISDNNIEFQGLDFTNYLVEKNINFPLRSVGKLSLRNQDNINFTKVLFNNLELKIFEETQIKNLSGEIFIKNFNSAFGSIEGNGFEQNFEKDSYELFEYDSINSKYKINILKVGYLKINIMNSSLFYYSIAEIGISIIIQKLTWLFINSRVGNKISKLTCDKFPVGYGLIAKKNNTQ